MELFSPGSLLATRGVANLIEEHPEFDRHVRHSLERYCSGDWGDMCAEDIQQNEDAVSSGECRIFASYKCPDNPDWKIWIITEADRSSTTVLFPDEY